MNPFNTCICICVVSKGDWKSFKRSKKIKTIWKFSKKSKKFEKTQKNPNISKNPKKIKKSRKVNNLLCNTFLCLFWSFWIFLIFWIFVHSSFWNNFLLFWNLPILRKLHRVNPGEIELLFSRRSFWYIERIFSTPYAKSMGISNFIFKSCKKGPNSYFKICIPTRHLNLTTCERILFFEVFIIFVFFCKTKKAIHRGWDLKKKNLWRT